MRPHSALALLLLLLPGLVRAEDAPEQLLPADTQLYVRWDGLDAHRDAYARTALGQMMQGDTGRFINGVFDQVPEGLGSLLTIEELLRGAPPDRLQKMQADAAATARLLPALGRHGFILALEVRSVAPPQGQLTLILPNAGAQPDPLFGALRLAATLAQAEIKTRKIDGRDVSWLELAPLRLAWWVEGKHALVQLGTDRIEGMVKGTSGKDSTRLTANPLFKRLHSFHQFETSARAFLDVAALTRLAGPFGPDVRKLLADLGVDGIRSVVFYSGFDGAAERGLVEADVPGPRKGVVSLLGGHPFRLADVPPLPPDVVSWSMTHIDLAHLYDSGVLAVEDVMRLTSPADVPRIREFTRQADAVLGINLRKDFLGALGDEVVRYNSPSEGPLTLGQTILIKVKDGDKVLESADQITRGLANLAGAEVHIKKRNYRGTLMREVHARQQGFFLVPSYAVCKGWLVVGYYPQHVQGFIARCKGHLPGWEPSGKVAEALKHLPEQFVAVSYSDPRPSIRQILSVAPLIGGLVDSLNPGANFDVGSLPNAQEANLHLFPNVSVTTDDGKTVRQETRASLALPFDLTGMDPYAIFIGASVYRLTRLGG